MIFGIIYKITNKLNGKVYIGKTTKTIEERKFEHERKINVRGQVIYQAFRKYGLDSFDWDVIDSANDEDSLNRKEMYWISHYNSYGHDGYNMTIGGEGFAKGELHPNFGKKVSEETRRKMSERLKGENHFRFGKPLSEEHKQKLREAHKNYHFTDEHKAKISEACKGEKNGFFGKNHSEEARVKMSEAKKGGKSKHARAVVKLTLEGMFVERFDSGKEGADSVEGQKNGVYVACKGKRPSYKGFKWVYEEDYLGDADVRTTGD